MSKGKLFVGNGAPVESFMKLGVEWDTVYRPHGPQPKAYLRGTATSIYQHGTTIFIAP